MHCANVTCHAILSSKECPCDVRVSSSFMDKHRTLHLLAPWGPVTLVKANTSNEPMWWTPPFSILPVAMWLETCQTQCGHKPLGWVPTVNQNDCLVPSCTHRNSNQLKVFTSCLPKPASPLPRRSCRRSSPKKAISYAIACGSKHVVTSLAAWKKG